MIIVCAWCQEFLGEKAPYVDEITHSICKVCLERVSKEIEKSNDEKHDE